MSLVRTPRLLASLGIALVVFGGCGSEREVTLAAADPGALSVRIGALEALLAGGAGPVAVGQSTRRRIMLPTE